MMRATDPDPIEAIPAIEGLLDQGGIISDAKFERPSVVDDGTASATIPAPDGFPRSRPGPVVIATLRIRMPEAVR